jgi:hypothetical protein
MLDTRIAIAQYILSLHDAASKTHRAEDRPIYQMYLADAAVLLALAETGGCSPALVAAITEHERLWGHSWLLDDAYKGPSSAWTAVKQSLP